MRVRQLYTEPTYLKKLFIIILVFCGLSTFILTSYFLPSGAEEKAPTYSSHFQKQSHQQTHQFVTSKSTQREKDNKSQGVPFAATQNKDSQPQQQSSNKKDSSSKNSKETGLDIVFIPHSHCDPGWIYTFDDYFDKQVKLILDNIVELLYEDENRKFIWSEISFFNQWWISITDETKSKFRKIVSTGQLEFVGGGWVQNDEAVAQMDDVIDQLTEGRQWLKRHLDVDVEYAWQIDPFGHSSLTPSIMSLGQFKAMVGNRINIHSLNSQRSKKEMDFIWQPTQSNERRMLTHVLYNHYSYVDGYPDKGSLSERLDSLASTAQTYFNTIRSMKDHHQTKVLLLPMGNDFAYMTRDEYLFNEELIRYMLERKDEHGIATIRMATVREYFELFNNEVVNNNIMLPLFRYDYLPLINSQLQPWTGFFTQFSIFKKLVRDTSLVVKTADMFYSMAMSAMTSLLPTSETFGGRQLDSLYPMIEEARRYLGLTQHHDGVTGTARNKVMRDYQDSLNIARQRSYQVLSSSLEYLIHLDGETDSSNPFEFRDVIDMDQIKMDSGDSFSLVFHNSLAWRRQHHYTLRIRLSQKELIESVQVLDSETLDPVMIQIIPILPHDIKQLKMESEYTVVFIIDLPAFGVNSYFITMESKQDKSSGKKTKSKLSEVSTYSSQSLFGESGHTKLSSRYLEAEFNSNGFLKSMKKNVNNQVYSVSLNQVLNSYSTYLSGNYVFRPNQKFQFKFLDEYRIYVVNGPLLSQVTIASFNSGSESNSMVMVYHRLYNSPSDFFTEKGLPMVTEETVELGYSIYGFSNIETVFNFQPSLDQTDCHLYTDNGQETRARIKSSNNYMEINYNYYPVLGYAHLKDKDLQFTVFTERTHGVGSNNPTDLEIMIHRTTLQDDAKGLNRPAFDYTRVDSKLYLSIDSPSRIASSEKQLSLHYTNTPIVLSKLVKDINLYLSEYQVKTSYLNDKIPSNLHINSIKYYQDSLNNGQALLNMRFSHLMAVTQSDKLSTMITQKTDSIFSNDYTMTHLGQTDITFLPIQPDFQSYCFYKMGYEMNQESAITGQPEFGEKIPMSVLNSDKHIDKRWEAEDTEGHINLNPLDIKSYQVSLKYSSDIFKSNLKYKVVKIQTIPFEHIYTHDFSTHKVSTIPHQENSEHYP